MSEPDSTALLPIAFFSLRLLSDPRRTRGAFLIDEHGLMNVAHSPSPAIDEDTGSSYCAPKRYPSDSDENFA